MDIRAKAMTASLAVAFLMLVGKLTAYLITGSAAIFSDAMESVIHILATAGAGFSLWYSFRPATKRHPYGHGKIGYFSAGFEGALIFAAAIAIFYMAALELIDGADLRELDVGIAITAALAAVNLALGLFLVRTGTRQRSLILLANGKHILTDAWTSGGVVVGVAAVRLTGAAWLDPLVAILVGLNITFSGFGLMRRAMAGLLDEAPPADAERIEACLNKAVKQGLLTNYHELRHRQSGEDVWIELHMLFSGAMLVREAHARATRVEEELRALFSGFQVHVTSHVEPIRHDTAHPNGHPETGDAFLDCEDASGLSGATNRPGRGADFGF